MSFDDNIHDGLRRRSDAFHPVAPAAAELMAKAARRRRMRAALVSSAASLVVVVIAVAALSSTASAPPRARLNAADSPTGAGSGASPNGEALELGSTTSTNKPGGPKTTSATIAPSGTAYSPPPSVVYPGTTPPSTTPSTVPPNPSDTVTVTQDDEGKTVTLRVGQHLVVQLQAPSGQYWSSAPDTSDASILRRESTSANPSSDRVTASFVGQKAGHAQVSAAEDATCRQSTPACMTPTRLWQIQVDVI